MDLSLHLVRQIRAAVEQKTRRTPMRFSDAASRRSGAPVWFKMESLQITGSFKARGPLAVRAQRCESQRWVAASAGNHGLGVAYALRGVAPPPHIFVPRSAAQVKRDAIAALDAEITVVDSARYDDAERTAKKWAADHEALFVSPFDDPLIMAGNGGTLGLEVLEQLPDVGSIVVPVGGGGLASGVGCVVRALQPGARLVGVQSELTCAMHESLQRGAPVLQHSASVTTRGAAAPSKTGTASAAASQTLAEGLEGGVSARSYEFVSSWYDEVRLVSERSVAQAMRWLWDEHAVRVEGSAAVGVAALLDGLQLPGPVCVILTGCNVDDDTWNRVMAQTD